MKLFALVREKTILSSIKHILRINLLFCLLILFTATINIGSASETYVYVNTNDSIQNAIDSIGPEGGIVELAPGTWTIDSTLLINKSNIIFRGAGKYSTIIEGNVGMILLHVIGDNATFPDSWTGPFPGAPPNPAYIVNVSIENMTLRGAEGIPVLQAHDGIYLHENWNTNINNVSVERTGGNSIAIVYSHNISIIDNFLSDSFSGIVFFRSYNSTVLNNSVQIGRRYGIEMNTGNVHITVENNTVSKFSVGGFYLYGSREGVWRNNIVYSNKNGADISPGANINLIENNVFRDNTMYGIWMRGQYYSGGHTIKNNLIYSNGQGGIVTVFSRNLKTSYNITVESNTIVQNGGDGIFNDVPDYTFYVKNNIIANNTGYGIRRTAGGLSSTYNNIYGNTLGRYNGTTSGMGDMSVDSLFADVSINDFHLKSQAGRWTDAGWIIDPVTSPAIDVGSPSSDYSNEPMPNGGRINMGAYGNTLYASKSASSPSSSNSAISITSSTTQTPPNQPFTLTIPITQTTNLTGAQFNLNFDNSLATVISVTEGNLLNQGGAATFFNNGTINNAAGTVTNTYGLILGNTTVSSQGSLATISMTAGSNTGYLNLNLTNIIISDANSAAAPYTLTNATVLIDTAPVLSSIGAKSVDEASVLSFTTSASDDDGDSLTYSATNLPTGASLNTATGVFLWTPANGDAGTYAVTFEATDGYLNDSKNVTITVNNANNAPVITTFVPANSLIFNELDVITVGIIASDADGNALTYNIKIDGVTKSTSSNYVWETDYSSAGTHTIDITVSDGIEQVIDSRTITINDVRPRWDVNEDGIVDVLDISIIGQKYGTSVGAPYPRWDVNQDGGVNKKDMTLTGIYFGETVA